eukprot:gb/GFBE01014027.1/.p1 GENE.gb/GFBE01014027.1/~~gb/GFBE01014027.1/.p1  ORF type:complete len:240 (+),score=67.70 gb/GFBE01014027.1/:1-720(+)
MSAASKQATLLFVLFTGAAALSHPDYHKGAADVQKNSSVYPLLLQRTWKGIQDMEGDELYVAAQQMLPVLVLGLAAAYYFKKNAKMPEHDHLMKEPDMQAWSSGPFDCFQNLPIAAWACCCPGVRWAGNLDQVKLLDFWPAFAIFLSLELIGMIPSLYASGLLLLGIMVYYRNQMRRMFNMPNANAPMTVCGDCAFVCCCSCCAIAQEARHLEIACKINHEAVAAQRAMMEEAPEQQGA